MNEPSNHGVDLRTTEEIEQPERLKMQQLLTNETRLHAEVERGLVEMEPYLTNHLTFGRWTAEQERVAEQQAALEHAVTA